MENSKGPKSWDNYSNSVEFLDELEFISRLIDVYVATSLDRSMFLPERLQQFMAISILLYNQGLDIGKGKKINDAYKELGNFNTKNGEVSNYRRDLKDRDWLKKTKGGYTLPEFFINFSNELKLGINMNLVKVDEREDG